MIYYWQWPDGEKGAPGAWSWFHIMFLFIFAIVIFVLVLFAKKHDKKIDRRVLIIFGVSLLCIELFKQINYVIYFKKYLFRYFLLVICSLPIYCLFASIFIKNEKIKKTVNSFGAYTGFIGGLGVMMAPAAALKTPFVMHSIFTMVWHIMICGYGIYYFISNKTYKDDNIKDLFSGFILLCTVTVLAIILNESIYYGYLVPNKLQETDSIKCLYISSHYNTDYPILNKIWGNVPYPVFVLIFLLFFMSFMVLVLYIQKGIYLLVIKIKNKKNKQIN